MTFKVPEEHRVIDHPTLGSTSHDGNNGCFTFKESGLQVRCIASDGKGWEHVSISLNRNKNPSWRIMSIVKDMFWGEEDCVIQYHPPKSMYVNMHPYCLHLWRSVDKEIPIPDPIYLDIESGYLKKAEEEFDNVVNKQKEHVMMNQTPDVNGEERLQAEMPKYLCHKRVWALKIKAINDVTAPEGSESDGSKEIVPEEANFAPFKIDSDYITKHDPQVGGYYVVYEGGYKSFSPADAFEGGYTKIDG